jgi:hypothetical protein
MHKVESDSIWSGGGETDGETVEEKGATDNGREDETLPKQGSRKTGGTAHQEDEGTPEAHAEEVNKERSPGSMLLTPD